MNNKKKNIQKPTEVDAHLRYKCPDENCGLDHWLSLKETQTKNFKVVCDCGVVFKPKRIKKLKIVYVSDVVDSPKPVKITIPVDLQNSCVKLLVGYGFTKDESITLVTKAFDKTQITNAGSLIKYILANIGELNEPHKTPNIVQ